MQAQSYHLRFCRGYIEACPASIRRLRSFPLATFCFVLSIIAVSLPGSCKAWHRTSCSVSFSFPAGHCMAYLQCIITQTQTIGAARARERGQFLIKLHLKITKLELSLKLYEIRRSAFDLKPDNLSARIRLRLGNIMAHRENSNCGNKVSLLAASSSRISLWRDHIQSWVLRNECISTIRNLLMCCNCHWTHV